MNGCLWSDLGCPACGSQRVDIGGGARDGGIPDRGFLLRRCQSAAPGGDRIGAGVGDVQVGCIAARPCIDGPSSRDGWGSGCSLQRKCSKAADDHCDQRERKLSPNAANVMGRRNSTEEICSFHTTIDPHRSGTVQKKKRKREISLKY